jgi:hypothetical protein
MMIFSAWAVSGCGGGGGGGGSSTPTDPTFFLTVDSPLYDGQTYYVDKITVSGSTNSNATVKVNNVAVTVAANGTFSRANVDISSISTITVVATRSGNTKTVARTVNYQNPLNCEICGIAAGEMVYIAPDPVSGYNRVFAADPSSAATARRICDDLPGRAHSYAAISPVGKQVIFVRDDGAGNQSVAKAACVSNTETLTTLASGTGVRYSGLSWSHDAAKIAYSSDASGQYDIYTMTSAGGSVTRITTHSARDEAPAWQSGNNALVYSSYRAVDGGTGSAQNSNLWKITVNPLGAASLLYDPSGAGAPACAAGVGQCSAKNPDIETNGKVIFQFDHECGASGGGQVPPVGDDCSDLFVMSSISANPAAVSSDQVYLAPKWNAAGNSIVFVDNSGLSPLIKKINFAGSTPGAVSSSGITGYHADH